MQCNGAIKPMRQWTSSATLLSRGLPTEHLHSAVDQPPPRNHTATLYSIVVTTDSGIMLCKTVIGLHTLQCCARLETLYNTV